MMKCTIIPQDIPQKMSESIFRYKGVPYYVKNVGGMKIALYNVHNVNGNEIAIIKYDDDDLDFSSVPLGYVNYSPYESAIYLTRFPVRKVKQGVNQNNTKISYLPGSKKNIGGVINVLFSKAFEDMVLDKYPSLEEAIHKLRQRGRRGEIAISCNIALEIDEQEIIKVYYKNKYVGWIQPNKLLVHVKADDLGWVVSKYLSHILGWQID